MLDGVMDESRKRWARSAWRQRAKAHEAFAAAGLAIRGRSTWNPKATCLFEEPDPIVPAPKLAPIDDDALTRFVALVVIVPDNIRAAGSVYLRQALERLSSEGCSKLLCRSASESSFLASLTMTGSGIGQITLRYRSITASSSEHFPHIL